MVTNVGLLARSDLNPGQWVLSWIRRQIKTGKTSRPRQRRSQHTVGLSDIKGEVGFNSVEPGGGTRGCDQMKNF